MQNDNLKKLNQPKKNRNRIFIIIHGWNLHSKEILTWTNRKLHFFSKYESVKIYSLLVKFDWFK